MRTLKHLSKTTLYINFLLSIIVVFSDAQVLIDGVIAVVNEQAITQSELVNEFRIRSIIDKPMTQEPTEEEKRERLNHIINRKFVLQEADRIGITDTDRKKQVAERIATMQEKLTSKKELDQALQRHEIEIQTLEKWVYELIIFDDYYRLKFINSVNRKEIDDLAPQYFETNKDQFIAPATVTFRSILIKVAQESSETEKKSLKMLADRISVLLKQGDEFAEVMQNYKTNNSVSFDSPTLKVDTQLGTIVSQLKPNDRKGPIAVPEGYRIVELVKKTPSRQKQYSEVKDEIAILIRNNIAENSFKKWLTRQKEDDPWYILDDALERVSGIGIQPKK